MRWFRPYAELIFWIAGLLLLALMNPVGHAHYSLCMLRCLGVSWCPGCGIGHSISFLLHGEWLASFSAHPLGLFALLVIVHRIYGLLGFHFHSRLQIRKHGQQLQLH